MDAASARRAELIARIRRDGAIVGTEVDPCEQLDGPGSSTLGKSVSSVSPSKSLGICNHTDWPTVLSAGVERYRLLDALRPYGRHQTAKCRKVRIGPVVQVQHKADNSIAFAGLGTCGSVWSCPVCASRIYAERAKEIQFAVNAHRATGGHVYMATLTIAHDVSSDLRYTRRGLAEAWRALWQGKGGRALRQSLDVRHYVRAVELTHGDNGFHPHLHILLFTTRQLTETDSERLLDSWQNVVLRKIGAEHVPNDEHGLRLTEAHRATYIADLGLEISGITRKDAKNGNRTMWQVARDARDGDERSQKLWHVYSEAMLGARQLTWSVGTKKFFMLGEKDDEELANDAEPVGAAYLLAEWQGGFWDALARRYLDWTTRVVQATVGGAQECAKLPGQAHSLVTGHIEYSKTKRPSLALRRDKSNGNYVYTEEMRSRDLAEYKRVGQEARRFISSLRKTEPKDEADYSSRMDIGRAVWPGLPSLQSGSG